jgi:DNA-binding beta-propeller fold protein YncE
MIRMLMRGTALAALVTLPCLGAAQAQIAVSANDNKIALVDGVNTVPANPPPDTVTILDIGVSPPKVLGELQAPSSVVGVPQSVAVSKDESFAIVTSAMKVDPADPKKTTPDDRISVIDLKANPPAVIATLEAGASPAGVSINRQGNLALVANRAEGTVSIFTIQGKTVASAGKVTVGDAKSGVSHATIAPDGKTALVSRDGDDRISVLSIDGTKVEYTKRDLTAGLRPYGIDIAASGAFAAVANIGRGQGDADTVSLIDMKATPPRVVETITVGQTPEGIKVSPDGQHVAVVVMNGSNKAKSSPFYNDNGKLVMLKVTGTSIAKVAEAPIGRWSQGAAFAPDGKTVLVGNMVEKDVQVFAWDGTSLRETARIKVNGGSAALRTAEK